MRSQAGAAMTGHAVGLDVSHSAAGLVEIQSGRLLRWATAPIPAGAMASGMIRDAAAVAEAVRGVLATAGAEGQPVVSGVSGAACFIRRMQFPDLAPKDLQRAVRWEAERLLPYPFDEAAVDYDVLVRRTEGGRSFTDIILVGARVAIVEAFRSAIELGGAKLDRLDAMPLARLRAYHREVTAPGVLLVHLGPQWTEVTASDEHGLVFTRTMSSGASMLLEEVVRSARFFETQAGTQVVKIMLTGSGAEDPQAAAMFAAADLPPAVVVDPLAGLAREATVPTPPGLRLAGAAGLAMSGVSAASKERAWR